MMRDDTTRGRAVLDRAAFLRNDLPKTRARRDPVLPVSRRRLLQSGLASVAGLHATVHAFGTLSAKHQDTGFVVRMGKEILWQADTRWLTSPSAIAIRNGASAVTVSIGAIRYPGTTTSAQMSVTITANVHGVQALFSHSLAVGAQTVDLRKWVASQQPLVLEARSTPFRFAGLSVRAPEKAWLELRPDLGVELRGKDGMLAIEGRLASGKADSCRFEPTHQVAVAAGEDKNSRMMRASFASRERAILLTPQTLSAVSGLRADAFHVAHISVDLVEGSAGLTRHAIVARAVPQLVLREASVAGSESTLLVARGATYAIGSDGGQILHADRLVAKVSNADAVFLGRSSNGTGVILDASTKTCTVDCAIEWLHGSFSHTDGISMTLRAKEGAGAALTHQSIGDVLSNAPWRLDRMPLDGAELEFLRAEDSMWLRFHMRGYELCRAFTRLVLRRVQPQAGNPKPLLWLVLPPQSISEEAFFRAPRTNPITLQRDKDKYGIPLKSTENEKRKGLGNEIGDYSDRVRDGNDNRDEPVPLDKPVKARISGSSHFCFERKLQASDEFELRLGALLDPDCWTMLVADSAHSTLDNWRKHHGKSGFPTDATPSSLAETTKIEMPWRMVISPDEQATLRHAPITLKSGSFNPVFYLTAQPASKSPLPLRVIWSPDHDVNKPLQLHYGANGADPRRVENRRQSLDEQDRNQLVWLTARWGRDAILGTSQVQLKPAADQDDCTKRFGIYEPKPFYAPLWRLTALGGTMRSSGTWDPPYFRGRNQLCDEISGGLAMSIEEWTHASSQARSHFDRVVYRGFLMPYGHRAVLIKISQREVEEVGERGFVAVNTQKYFIRVIEPELRYPLVGQPASSVNAFCQPETLRIVLPIDLQIDDPGKPDEPNKPSDQLNKLGPSAFIIKVEGKPHPFDLVFGVSTRATTALAFVDNTVTHAPDQLVNVVNDFNAVDRLEVRTVSVEDGDIVYAPSSKLGDTTLPTRKLKVRAVIAGEFINSVLLESARRAPFYPVIDHAEVIVRSIGTQTGQGLGQQSVWVSYDSVYRSGGFDPHGNPAEVYLDLETAQPLGFRGRSDRSGGVSNTDMTARALSRSQGIVAFQGADAAQASPMQSNKFGMRTRGSVTTVESNVSFDTSAKILGAIPLFMLLESLGIDELPRLIEEVQHRLDAAGKDLVAQALPIVEGASRSVNESASDWRAMCGDQANDNLWCKGSDYLGLQLQLDGLAKQLELLRSKLKPGQETDPNVLKELANTGKMVLTLAESLRDIAQRPELLLSSMIKGPEFAGLFLWFDDLVKLIQGGPAAQILNTAINVYLDIQAKVDELKDFKSRTKQIRQDLENRAYGISRQAHDQVFLLMEELKRQGIAWEKKSITQSVSALITSASGMAVRLLEIYDIYQGLHDELRVVVGAASNYNSELLTFVEKVKLVQEKLPEEFNAARKEVFNALSEWERTVETQLNDTAVVGTQEIARRIEPHLREMRDLCLAIAESQGAIRAKGDLTVVNVVVEFFRCVDAVDMTLIKAKDEATSQLAKWIEVRRDNLKTNAEVLTKQIIDKAMVNLNAFAIDLADASTALLTKLGPIANDVKRVDQLLKAINNKVIRTTPQEIRGKISVLLEVASIPACLFDAQPAPENCLNHSPLCEAALKASLEMTNALWSVLSSVLLKVNGLVDANGQISQGGLISSLANSEIAKSVLGSNFAADLTQLSNSLAQLSAIKGPLDLPKARQVAAALALRPGPAIMLQDLMSRLDAVQVMRNIKEEVVRKALAQLASLAAKFIPAKISTSYEFSREITRDYCNIFLPGIEGTCSSQKGDAAVSKASIKISTQIEADLIVGTSSYSLKGSLEYFRVNIFDMIKLPVRSVEFSANAESGFHLETPKFCNPVTSGSLQFIRSLLDSLGLSGGFFLLPMPNGIKSGFFFRKSLLQSGGMTLQNFSFEAALMLPFDDRSAEVSCAIASREEPFLISMGPYGGGGFFEMVMAMDRLISISASFEYGLVGAFDLSVVTGRGRVTIGLYYRQAESSTVLEGFFYAGGDATVLGIVSISANLTVRLTCTNGQASGEGRFGVRIGAGPFAWTLRYSVTHNQGGADNKEGGVGQRIAALGANSRHDYSTLITDASLLENDIWIQYKQAFAKDTV